MQYYGKIDRRQFARYITLCNITLCIIVEKWKNAPAIKKRSNEFAPFGGLQFYFLSWQAKNLLDTNYVWKHNAAALHNLMQYYRKMEESTRGSLRHR